MTEAEVIDRINSTIKKNGKNAITGEEMNFVLKAIIQLIEDAGGVVNWGDIEGTIADQLDLINLLDDKVDVVAGKGLSTNDFTNTLKSKLDGIQAGAEVNVNADWNAVSGDAQILNKPTIPDPADFVAKSDYTPAHSILVQQSGTGSPTAVTIGTNEFLGRKSGGGSDIEGLSVSEAKSILNYTASDVGAPSGSGTSTGTNTGDNFAIIGGSQFINTGTGGSERFIHPYTTAVGTQENVRQIVIPCSMAISKFFIQTGQTQSATGSHVLILRKNGVDTSVQVTIPAGSASGVFSDTANSVTFNAGDLLGIRMINNASTSAGQIQSMALSN